MDNLLYTDPLTQRTVPAWMSTAVDELLYKVRHKNIWEIVDFCIEMWAKKYPVEHKKFLKEMASFKKNRANKFASSETKSMRQLVELPRDVNYLLDKIASHKIADYGEKKFWREFARRYPAFSPAQSI